jgi:hypothetical protein
MTPDTLFKVASLFAGLGWFSIIVLSPFWKSFDKFVIGIVAAMLAIVYTWLNFKNFNADIFKNFSSLDGVATLFQNKDLLNACWVHILCFDLIGAVWMKKNSLHLRIKHAAIIPSLIFTCVFGPLGFLLYLGTRLVVTKRYFSENY